MRLNVVNVALPPLRDRREDIPLLAAAFLAKRRNRSPRRIAGLSPAAQACLLRYDWPGNVRELENAIERAVVLGCSEWIEPEDLPQDIAESSTHTDAGQREGYHRLVAEAKRRLLLAAIAEAGGDLSKAARALALNRTYLHRLLRQTGVRPASA